MSEYKIDEQEWKSWPKAVMMRRDWTTNGHDHRKEVRRYVPDDESVMLSREVNRLRSTVKSLESRLRDGKMSDRRMDDRAERLRGRVHDIARDRDKLKAENAKLRELVRRYSEYTDQDSCEGCVLKRSCNDGEIDECWQIAEIRELARELGIEV